MASPKRRPKPRLKPYLYRYCRVRADGTVNETSSLATFERWLKKEGLPGDEFFVARYRWVQATVDELLSGSPFRDDEIVAHVGYVRHVTPIDNGPTG